jgi:hypothetical protein
MMDDNNINDNISDDIDDNNSEDNNMVDVPHDSQDLTYKLFCTALRNGILDQLNIKCPEIIESVNIEMNKINIRGIKADFVGLLENDTYLHLEFQSTVKKGDLKRFMNYDIGLNNRDGREPRTIVIYAPKIKEAPDTYKMGGITYKVENVMLSRFDEVKIASECVKDFSGKRLTNLEEVSKLALAMILTAGHEDKENLKKCGKLVHNIEDDKLAEVCLTSIATLGKHILTPFEISQLIREVKDMSALDIFFKEAGLIEKYKNIGIKEGKEEGRQEGREEGREEG